MTTDPTFDRFVEVLNAPASASELAAEAEVVATMHGLVSPSTGVGMIIKTILGHKIAAAVTATAIGTSGAAAASGNMPFLIEEEPAPTAVVVESEAETEAGDPVIEPVAAEVADHVEEPVEDSGPAEDEVALPPVDENGEAYGDVECDDASNHGEYVSSVAKDDTIDGPRGQVVAQAAQTDCGKADEAETDQELEEEEETDDVESAEADDVDSEDDRKDDDDRRGNGNGNGNDNGRGNGNANGNGRGGSASADE